MTECLNSLKSLTPTVAKAQESLTLDATLESGEAFDHASCRSSQFITFITFRNFQIWPPLNNA